MVIPLGTLTCGPSRPEKQDGFRVRGQIARRARPIVSSPDCESSTMFLLGLVLRLFSSERPDFGLSVTPLFGGASPLLAGFLSQSGLAKKIFVGQLSATRVSIPDVASSLIDCVARSIAALFLR